MVCSEAATAYGYGSGDAATDSTTRFGSLPDAAVRESVQTLWSVERVGSFPPRPGGKVESLNVSLLTPYLLLSICNYATSHQNSLELPSPYKINIAMGTLTGASTPLTVKVRDIGTSQIGAIPTRSLDFHKALLSYSTRL